MKMTMPSVRSVELRKANRYKLGVPVFFFWAEKKESEQYGQGITRDIGTSGVYVQTNTLPQVGARILFDILLPKLADPGNGMHLTGDGVVLRVDPQDAKGLIPTQSGFAASMQFYPERPEVVLKHMNLDGRAV
jgi:hypothetical protein